MPSFKPIRPARVSEEVTEQLKRSILLGDFKAGDRLPPERSLAEEFQVSRVAIRDALRSLETSGFVAIRQGATGGAFVTELTFESLNNAFLDLFLSDKISLPELQQVRLVIEPEVAALAAERVTEAHAQRLKEALAVEEEPIRSLAQDIEVKGAVHYILAQMCGNRFFEAVVRSMLRLTSQVVAAVQPDPRTMHPEGLHRPVVQAVLSGDRQAAAREMKKHAEEFGRTLLKMEKAFRNRRR